MSQNGQTHFKNLAANAARFLKCVRPFWDSMHERVKKNLECCKYFDIMLDFKFIIYKAEPD